MWTKKSVSHFDSDIQYRSGSEFDTEGSISDKLCPWYANVSLISKINRWLHVYGRRWCKSSGGSGKTRYSNLFGEAPTLATRVTLGMSFIDKHVRCMEPDRRLVTVRNGSEVWILASFPTETTATADLENEMRPEKFLRKLAKMKSILPCSKGPVPKETKAARTYVLERC